MSLVQDDVLNGWPESAPSPPDETKPPETKPATSDSDKGHSDSGVRPSTDALLSPTVRDYVFENSRRPHESHDSEWLRKEEDRFPSGSPEQERENMRHCMLVHLRQGALHFAPVRDPRLILDIGTGTGSWVIDMAKQYPRSRVIGHDLATTQLPTDLDNVQFVAADVDGPWDVDANAYDLVHIRNMARVINNWPLLISEAYRAVAPGGWIEIQDIEWDFYGSKWEFPPDCALARFGKFLRDGWFQLGGYEHFFEETPARLASAGFTSVRSPGDALPIGPWLRGHEMKTMGLYSRSILYDSLEDIATPPLVQGLKWAPADVESFLVDVRKDLLDPEVHSSVSVRTLQAQKPS